MGNPYRRDTLELWISDFADTAQWTDWDRRTGGHAASCLLAFLTRATDVRDVEPADLEATDLLPGLMEGVAPLAVPPATHRNVPDLVAAFLQAMETQGRLADGRAHALRVRAMRASYLDRAAGRGTTLTRPGSKLGRNDPCPCGSGKKYKKCCQRA